MMKTAKWLLMLSAAIFMLSGCLVQSVNRYYTQAAVCPAPSVSGEWRLLDDKGAPVQGNPWIFSDGKVITNEKNAAPATLKAVYFRVGESLFLDTTADEPAEAASRWWTMHVFPVHVVTKVVMQKDRLTLTPVDYSWLEKAIKDKAVTLPHILPKDDDMMLFTASPEEWTDFLEKYADDPKAFSDKNALRFIR